MADREWHDLATEKPAKEGMYLIFAPSADPNKPLRHASWWSVENQRFEGLVPMWLDAITHWAHFPGDPK